MVDYSKPSIILDNGSGYLKCGLSTSPYPDFTLPALVGRPMLRYEESLEGMKIKVSNLFKLQISL